MLQNTSKYTHENYIILLEKRKEKHNLTHKANYFQIDNLIHVINHQIALAKSETKIVRRVSSNDHEC